MQELSGADQGKRAAAAMALEQIEPGMTLGLGSGSTAEWFVRLLGESGLDVKCTATSKRTASLAKECGIKIHPLDNFDGLDLTIDGADEIDTQLNLIKGGGACHLIEKIVAASSDRLFIIADDSKLVPQLGAFPLPVEIATFGWQTTQRMVELCMTQFQEGAPDLSAEEPAEIIPGNAPRRMKEDSPVLTDEGNYILDLSMGTINEPLAFSYMLNAIPGVIENGLFLGMASRAYIGFANGTARMIEARDN